jgi:phosphate transport system substrate-binding protein
VQIEDSGQLVDKVAGDPLGIGFVGFGYVAGVLGVHPLAVGDPGTRLREPTIMTIATEDYVLHRRLYFYVPQTKRKSLVDQFIRFVQSDEGQKIVSNTGFVGQNIQDNLRRSAAVARAPAEDASPEYRELFTTAVQLPMTIKFQTGSADLDNKARADLERLVRHVAYDSASHVILVGFSDNVGDPQGNLKLSRDRAKTVAEQLDIRGLKAEVRGEGQRSPVESNETESGRDANRRVEIWLQK